MRLRKYWRELYLTVMMLFAYAIIIGAAVNLTDLPGLSITAVGVFIAVLGVGLYDQWREADPTQARAKNRR